MRGMKIVASMLMMLVLLMDRHSVYAELPNEGEQQIDIGRIESSNDEPVVEEKTVLEEKGIVLFEEEQSASLEAQKQAEQEQAETLDQALFLQEEQVASYQDVTLPPLFTDDETSHLAAADESTGEDEKTLRYGFVGGVAALLGSVVYLFRGTFE